jgi:hypothetical protein
MLNVQSVYKRMYNQENRRIRIYRVSLNYRIPSSGLSRRHPVYQVKMLKKIAHFEKNIKVANICSKVFD